MAPKEKIKVVILCGGQGSRIKDVSEVLPKPMISIGGRPILLHIMKKYAHYGYNDFILCLGYKGWVIKEFFLNYYSKMSDFSMTLGKQSSIVYHNSTDEENWNVTLVETGDYAETGTRVRSIRKHLADCEMFSLTYGDGVADINISALLEAHKKNGLLGTITGVHPSGRFGEIELAGNRIVEFNEKPNVSVGLINGGFMVFNRAVLDKYFHDEGNVNMERDIIPKIVQDGQVGIYRHAGFWDCMDTPREYNRLNQLWDENKAFWKVWA